LARSASTRHTWASPSPAYGAGLILARWCAGHWRGACRRWPPDLRPAVAVIAAGLFLAAPSGNGFAYAAAGHFCGLRADAVADLPITVRQLVKPAPLMAGSTPRCRPRSTACGRWARWRAVSWRPGRPARRLLLIAAAFALSTLCRTSPLARLRVLPEPPAPRILGF